MVAVLARGLDVDLDAKGRRQQVLRTIHESIPRPTAKLENPAKLIREDRRRSIRTSSS